MTLTATVHFAGGGGSSEGLRRAGISVVAAANHDPTAIATHSANHADTEHFTANLMDVDYRMFPRTDIAWLSPSCVWHAPAGGRKQRPMGAELIRNHPGSVDRATAFAVIATAEVHLHDAIIVENVPEFASWTLYRWWLAGLESLGYRVQEIDIDAVTVGAPQYRKRRIIVATLGADVDLTIPEMPAVPASTILDPDPGKPLTRRLYVSPQIDQITDDQRHLVTYRKHAKPRPADSTPLATITAGGNHHAVAQIIDGVPHARMLTNRECARGQGFPDNYRWHGTTAEVKAQIGNAVAVPVAEFIGRRVAAALGAAA